MTPKKCKSIAEAIRYAKEMENALSQVGINKWKTLESQKDAE